MFQIIKYESRTNWLYSENLFHDGQPPAVFCILVFYIKNREIIMRKI